MTYAELKRYLRKVGARKLREGANHEMWQLGSKVTSISRHNREEVKPGTKAKILKDLGLK